MIAQELLLGRPRIAHRIELALADGGAVPRAVLTVLLFCALTFESNTADPIMQFGTYIYRGLASWSAVPLFLSPLEIALIVGVILSLMFSALGRPTEARPLRWPMLAFVGALAFGVVRGELGQGDMYIALWEVRYLLYVPALFIIVRASIRRPEHIAWLLWTGLIAVTIFAVEGAYRKLVLVNTGALAVPPEFQYEHVDVIFLASFFALVAGSLYFRVQTRLRTLGLLAAPVIGFTLLASNRRAGILVLLVALIAVALVVFIVRRKAFFATAVPMILMGMLYVALFWNASGILGQPSRSIRSLYEPDPRDASSNLYRLFETYNIDITIHSDPLFGVGFGREFLMVVALADLSWWPFWRYETHNNVLWMWMKTGAIGYAVFWFLLGSAIARASLAARRLADPALRTAGLFCLLSLVGIVVFAYVDLGLVSDRVTLFLGTILGLVSVLPAIDRPQVKVREVRA